jgi:hypothetical protein
MTMMLDVVTMKTANIIESDKWTIEFFSLLIENFLEAIVFMYIQVGELPKSNLIVYKQDLITSVLD